MGISYKFAGERVSNTYIEWLDFIANKEAFLFEIKKFNKIFWLQWSITSCGIIQQTEVEENDETKKRPLK